MQRFYVAHRNLAAVSGPPRHASSAQLDGNSITEPSQEYEIQILDDAGRSVRTVYLSKDELEKTGAIADVPSGVLAAIRNLPSGVAVYVDEAGRKVSSF